MVYVLLSPPPAPEDWLAAHPVHFSLCLSSQVPVMCCRCWSLSGLFGHGLVISRAISPGVGSSSAQPYPTCNLLWIDVFFFPLLPFFLSSPPPRSSSSSSSPSHSSFPSTGPTAIILDSEVYISHCNISTLIQGKTKSRFLLGTKEL